MTTHDALLAAVIANHTDDLPRGVLADWYEEHGQPERAEFIRVQCELAKVPPEPEMTCSGMVFNSHRSARQHSETCQWCRWVGEHRDPSAPLRRREMELWDVVRELIRPTFRETHPGQWCIHINSLGGIVENILAAVVRRGFVSEIRCRLAEWCGGECGRCILGREIGRMSDGNYSRECIFCFGTGRTTGIGPRLVREHPVERVDLSGVVTHSIVPGSPFGAVTRESAGVLFDVAFQNAIGSRIEGNAEVLAEIISRTAIAWAKSTPVPAAVT